MKKILFPFLILITFCFSAKSQFFPSYNIWSFGENTGYYGSQFTDQNLYDLMYNGGARVARPVLPLQTWQANGISTFVARFKYPSATKGMTNNIFTFTVNPAVAGGPLPYTGESTYTTAGGNQSLLPASLYVNPFNGDSTINSANLWASYVGNIYDSIGAYYSYFECYNEPDENNDYYNAEYDSTFGNYVGWATYAPHPDQTPNVYDTMPNIVQLHKITWQVIHYKARHAGRPAYIATGGISLRYWWRQFLKQGGGQWVDVLSMHMYPYYYWTYYTNQSPNGPGNQRYSDMLLQANDSLYAGMQGISVQNGISANFLHMITETNTPEWNYDNNTFASNPGSQNKRVGNGHIQRNYTMKGVANYWLEGFFPMIWYATGESADSGNITSGSEFDAEGMYKNLTTATVGNVTFTQSGLGIQTMYTLLGKYHTDTIQPTAAAGTRVIRFDSAGKKAFMAWTKTNVDLSEVPSTLLTYNFGSTTYKVYNYDMSSPGTATGVYTLTGDPLIFIPQATSVVANAGSPQTITLPTSTVNLSASLSTGASTYSWSEISGPATVAFSPNTTSVNVTASNLTVVGTYILQVSVNGGVSTSTVTITVNPAPTSPCNCTIAPLSGTRVFRNIHGGPPDAFFGKFDVDETTISCVAPTVSAGSPAIVTLTPGFVVLTATATGNNGKTGVTNYVWSQVSGSNVTLVNPKTNQVTVDYSAIGVYVFKVVATDSCGQSGSSQVQVTVVADPAANSITVSPLTGTGSTAYVKGGNNITATINTTLKGKGTITLTDYPKQSWSKVVTNSFNKTVTTPITSKFTTNTYGTGTYSLTVTIGTTTFTQNLKISWSNGSSKIRRKPVRKTFAFIL